jgi:regulator of sigma E protease
MSVILFIIILAVLVFIHELGHFLIAKKTGVRVDEFAVGFPPKLFSFKRGETVYSLNAIPFGGYVKIFGEDPNEESIKGKDSSRSLVNKPKYIQIAVLIGGILFNILFAWLLISASLMSGYKMPVESATYPVTNAKITILSVLENSPAKTAGLTAGDEILSMKEGESIAITPQEVPDVQKFISESKSKIQISYERGSEMKTVDIEPALGIAGENRAIGISMSKVGEVHLPFFKAFWEGAKLTWDVVYQTFFSLIDFFGKVFRGKADISQVSGPVGIAGLVGDASHFGFIYLLGFTAFISINLAVINFMPFPALDGGRIFFIIIEAIIRRPISLKILNFVNALGFMFLIGLMLYVTYFDVIKLF